MNHILLLHSHPFRIRFDNRSAAQIHDRLREDLCAYQKLVYNCELIRSMHLVVGLRHSCAECHTIFQMMNISAAAQCLTLALIGRYTARTQPAGSLQNRNLQIHDAVGSTPCLTK